MAQRLWSRYPDHVCLWKMDIDAYQKSISTIKLSDERLNKLNTITAPNLVPLVEELKKRKRAGYQEALVDEMVHDIN
ncbi:DUF2399 domain-containing protein [Oceanobacillus halotolerans]|uniref:DUF2399 domain-containing protein n=1 Tax=Oceanobacillus halotolerans TaxID=2663380 RepID=UPI0013DD068D|nr:DUF2399 domain-containing protein [Oceanobacillus halotolerans]